MLLAGLLWGVGGSALAQDGGAYVGVTGAAERLGVFYEKAVDNTDPRNVSPSRGQVYRADDSATGGAYRVGFLAGYRFPVGSRLHLSADRSSTVQSSGQLSPSWVRLSENPAPSSYGATVRAGAAVGSGWSVYGLAGVRRLDARFSVDFTGCFLLTLCAPGVRIGDGRPRLGLHRMDDRRRSGEGTGPRRHPRRGALHRLWWLGMGRPLRRPGHHRSARLGGGRSRCVREPPLVLLTLGWAVRPAQVGDRPSSRLLGARWSEDYPHLAAIHGAASCAT